MKGIVATLIIAVAFVFGYGTANRWIASRPAETAPLPPVASLDESTLLPEPEPEPEMPAVEVEPEPEADPEPVVAMEAEVAEPEPVEVVEATPDPLPPIDFDSNEARISGTSEALDQALATTLESGMWPRYLEHLRDELGRRFDGLNVGDASAIDGAVTPPLARLALLQERVLTKLKPEVLGPFFADDHAFATWFLNAPTILDALYHNLRTSDEPEAVLALLADLHQEMPEALDDYQNLALACALVHDYGDGGPAEATRRFLWYVDKDEKKRLHRDVKTMPVSDLVYVVDGVDLDEMDWVQSDFRRDVPRSKAGKVYGKIEYRMELVTGDAKRNEFYPEYTLATIEEKGGICADQAHFASNVCRALAIPALYVSGSGNRGAHAWVAYQEGDGTWLTYGRYENYANGSFRDPQLRGSASESVLTVRNSSAYTSAARTQRAHNRFLLVDFLAESGDLQRATEAAIQVASSESKYVPAWNRLFELVEKQRDAIAEASASTSPAPTDLTADRVIDLVKDYEIALRDHPDMLDRADGVLTETLDGIIEDDDLLEILKRRRRRVETYDASRLGTILDLIRQEATILERSEGFTPVASLYRQELRKYGDDLQFFRKLAADFWERANVDGSRRDAALGMINAEVNSNFEKLLEGQDYFAKDTAISVYEQLANYYREAGKSSRADQLGKKIDRARKELAETKT